MATGRIRRTARRGLAAALLTWLGVAGVSVLLAPSAGAAPQATIEIRNLTPPVASVDSGGTVTFVNKIPAENRGGVSIPLPLNRSVNVSATVFTDVSVDFFGQRRDLQPEQSTSWQFSAPATNGTITYTYRVVPQASLPLGVSAQQVVDRVLGSLPPLPAPLPYVVQTVLPNLPNLPTVNLPQLPTVELPQLPNLVEPLDPEGPPPPPPGENPQQQPGQFGTAGNQYRYNVGGGPQLSPGNQSATAAFDPARFLGAGSGAAASSGRTGSGGGAAGSGGVAGSYDGASVPVFGQLAGLDGAQLDEESAATATAAQERPATLPGAALAAIVALAAVTAALVRTSQAARANR